MVRLLSWLTGVPLAILAVLFAISNRHPVRLEPWPLPFTVEVPVYLAVLGALALGMVMGAVAAWIAAGRYRRQARQGRRRAAQLAQEVETLRGSGGDAGARPLPAPGQPGRPS